ncbi:ABC transporter permease [Ornithinibacillus bavariensis]|uniref:ABC transporter permease n=1 Tax=Ornithinibacillus bavariensis TaxID=545502 RepID=UPI001BB39FFC|nr:ABC transporter permease [Ornithinibacillus bavariensis]
MQFLKFVPLFTKYNFLQLRRKWLSLPLLLLFPFLLIGLVTVIIVSYFSNLEENPLQIGLVDLDQTAETEMVVSLLEQSSQLGDFIHMKQTSEQKAQTAIEKDEFVSYILFPESFTKKLYYGESVVVTVVGNPNRQLESFLIKGLVDSAARHISASQANILTINHFAKQLDLDTKTRNEIVLAQFNEFLLYAIGKDQLLDQNKLTNNSTTSPIKYFGIAGAFFVITMWTVMVYLFLYKEASNELQTRMSLYGVTDFQQIVARIIVTVLITSLLGVLLFIGLNYSLSISMNTASYGKLILFIVLYNLTLLSFLALIEAIVPSQMLRLTVQILVTSLLLLASGSLIPAIYLPLYIQDILPFIFSNQVFYWLEEIMLNGRNYVEFIPIILTLVVGFLLLIGASFVKERVRNE